MSRKQSKLDGHIFPGGTMGEGGNRRCEKRFPDDPCRLARQVNQILARCRGIRAPRSEPLDSRRISFTCHTRWQGSTKQIRFLV